MLQLVWLRNDLRSIDNHALYYAAKKGSVCCVFCITRQQWQAHHDAPSKIALIRQQVATLQVQLAKKNIPLKLIVTPDFKTLPNALVTLATTLNIQSLWFNYEYPVNEYKRDQAVIDALSKKGISTHTFHSDLIHTPGSVVTQAGNPYHVFTPFAKQWRAQLSEEQLAVLPEPKKQINISITSDDIDHNWPINDIAWRSDLWPTGHKDSLARLRKFAQTKATHYVEHRDIPSIAGTSTLSPYFATGALSIRQAIKELRQYDENWLSNQWITELIWREFYRHLISLYPHLSMSKDFKILHSPIPWENNSTAWHAWCNGETGFPIVDAAMKQLQQTGWMHNRLRMVSAAFLTKLLLIDWRKGEQFFMENLIDGDYASNNGGWQWAASTGADAAPYFRIFNPQRQSERFDSEGIFIRKLLPQLSSLDNKSIHNPTSEQRKACGYSEPIIDYKFSRQRALDCYASAMSKSIKTT